MTKFAWYRRLPAQLVAVMTLALLPLGYGVISQSNRVAAEADLNAEVALLALTERAARSEQLLIEQAFGAAKLFGALAPEFIADPASCAPKLSRFIEENENYSFIGIVPLSGVMDCSSSPETFDLSDYPDFDTAMQAQVPTIVINRSAPASGQSTFIVSEPFKIDGLFAGLISISVPHNNLPDGLSELDPLDLVELITFNEGGAILTARSSLATAAQELPADRELSSIEATARTAFETVNETGQMRRYTVVPIEGSAAAVMGIWDPFGNARDPVAAITRPAFFPILIWFASMGVAMLAMHALVLRHIYAMRRNVTAFATTRRITPPDQNRIMPAELQALEENFQQMTDRVLRDEALLEDAVREKDVLVKEIHHRVKNNLQLISSLMNMHIRNATEPETRTVLSRLQDRVVSLATIHRDLYQSQDAGRVNVGGLVREIVEKSIDISITEDLNVTMDVQIGDVLLYPDQAVPLSLLVSEAVTNTLKYMGAKVDSAAWIKVRLQQEGDECRFIIANSVGPKRGSEGTGLGGQLMHAFAIQLGAIVETKAEDDSYTMVLRFSAEDFEPEIRDY